MPRTIYSKIKMLILGAVHAYELKATHRYLAIAIGGLVI
jgi:hypothetical protein